VTSHLGQRWLRAGLLVLLLAPWLQLVLAQPVSGFTSRPCHDDTSFARSNTHGSPINGTFTGGPPDHSNSYYYLDISVTNSCVASLDNHAHLLLQVTANGVGVLPGNQCSTSSWGPPCYPSARACIDTCLSNERPTWGFEWKLAATGTLVGRCAGGDGSGGNNCPKHPGPVVANPGNATVTWRFDRAVLGQAYRARIVNLYDDVIWEDARVDVVACSTCEPA
jgi:hypothetical protein